MINFQYIQDQKKESMRILNKKESSKFSNDAWFYLQKIYYYNIIDMKTREYIIEYAMLMQTRKISKKHIKSIELICLLLNNNIKK